MAKAVNMVSPMMMQHKAIKQKYPDAILLFRVGDFYETFGQDAVIAAQVLGITQTKRNSGDVNSMELAGFPHHALDTYLHKLVKAGYRVAICDQLEDPKQAKGVIKRGVTELITPGITTNDKLLDHQNNNFLAALHFVENYYGLGLLDISTGEFFLAEGDKEYIEKLLQSLKPAEIIFQKSNLKLFKEQFGNDYYTYTLDNWIFDERYAQEVLLNQFQTHSLKGFGIEAMRSGIIAGGAILHYLKETEHPHLAHLTHIQRIEKEEYLWMDNFTIRNLELLPTDIVKTGLFTVLNHTVTPMGARLLKRWLLMPLKNKIKIEERLQTVAYFLHYADLRLTLIQSLKQCGDIERLVNKIASKKINPRELVQLSKALQQIILIKKNLLASDFPYLKRLGDALNECAFILQKITQEVFETAPIVVGRGEVIKENIHPELDELRNLVKKGKGFLQEIQQREAAATGIPSLKIGFNNVFGYYLEVTNSHKNKVPQSWMRKQTLTYAERYITPELKEYETKILGAEEKIDHLEKDIYDKIILALQDFIAPIQTNSTVLAILDCLSCFAENALKFQYRMPKIDDGYVLSLKESRHPVIERQLPPNEAYVPNDIYLNPAEEQQIIILTGPNMSGKSALLRQTALITLMAHMGSFVPALEAIIPLTDKIFTRVGASDNLGNGESTFMVEMNETAAILNNLSSRSLILLDEIGRGTSTYDGISIAWSMVEFLHQSDFQPKTFFATHYHELNAIENHLERVKNFHITYKELAHKVLFLRKLSKGASHKSFGIQVAKMAGMPPDLIKRAEAILVELEQKSAQGNGTELLQNMSMHKKPNEIQLSIFDAHSEVFQTLRNALETIDINRLTPIEALMKLNEIKKIVQ